MSNGVIGRVDNLFRGMGLLACAMLIAACGGGDDDGIYDGVLAAAFEGEEDQLGFFLPWEHLRNRCATPRREGERGALAADQSGTVVDEKKFLRSYVHDTYLWYDEVEYIDPGDGQYSVADYFARMRTFEQTPSGRPKDQFSDSIATEAWQELIGGGGIGYGFEDYHAILDGQVVVRHVEQGSPAHRNGLSRGTRIVSINGRRYQPGTDIVEYLYPFIVSFSGYRGATFEVRDLGSATTRSFQMEINGYDIDPVRYTRVIETDTGSVGYIFFSTHNMPSEEELIEAFEELAEAEVTDLVLDMRYNAGGYVGVAAEVASMIAGPSATSGKVFDEPQFNDKHPTHDPIAGDPIEPLYFPTTAYGISAEAGTSLPSLNLNRVFILATGLTCSASEAIINGLRGIDVEVILIGDTTCGKPYGFIDMDNCGTTYFVVQVRGLNHKGFGEFPDGFAPQNATGPKSVSVPGCMVADDPEHALGDVNEAQLAAALRYRIDGSCPTPSRLATGPAPVGDVPRGISIKLMR